MCASVIRPHSRQSSGLSACDVTIGQFGLAGILHVPANADALVVFAHGSGSSRLSQRNMAVADALNSQGIATLLFDLLTPDEEQKRANVFDIPLLAGRLIDVVCWIDRQPELARLPLGLFGASTPY
jgi:putative phosphoribosyl transferase